MEMLQPFMILQANSKAAIAKARQQIADVIGAKKEEIYFTAGGSESDNWALKATFEAYKNKGNHIITTKSSIMPSFIPASTWKKSVVQRSHIWMWMRMVCRSG
jgi:hypothetical protein